MLKLKIENGATLKLGDRGLEVVNPTVEDRPSKHLDRLRREGAWNYDRGRKVAR